MTAAIQSRPVYIEVNESEEIQGDLHIPKNTTSMVVFAHGSGSSRHSPRNKSVASVLNEAGIATMLIDLLTPYEEAIDMRTAHIRFDIGLLSERLLRITEWLRHQSATKNLHIGYFGASTGAGAALVAAAKRPEAVEAVVSRGGRPDLAGSWLLKVHAPALLLVGGNDPVVIDLNNQAAAELRSEHRVEIIPGAGHLFEEPGALEKVSDLARQWFEDYLILSNRHVA